MSPKTPTPPQRPGPEPRARTLRGQRALNYLVRALSRIPWLSQVVGQRLVTLYVVGRNTGRIYAVPVAYLHHGGQLMIGTSSVWARNLGTGESIEIRLQGRRQWAAVEVLTGEHHVIAEYTAMARINPTFARFNGIRLSSGGEPDAEDVKLAWLAGARVIRLTPR
jgi:hypothetical protein